MNDKEKKERVWEELRDAMECWKNTDGFGSSDESECFEKVYILAAAWMRLNEEEK